MIETVMVAFLGALASALLFLGLIPFVNRRAARLALRKLEWRLPATPAEITAERDKLRAEIAVRERRAEQRIEAADKARLGDQTETGRKLIEIYSKSEEINQLNATLSERVADIGALTEAGLNKDIRISGLEADIASLKAIGEEQTVQIASLQANLQKAGDETAEQRLQIDALQANTQAQLLRIGDAEAELARIQTRLNDKTDEARGLDRTLRDTQSNLSNMTAARQRFENMASDRLDSLKAAEQKLAELKTELQKLAQDLARETKTRQTLEDDLERRNGRLAQIENELAGLRRSSAQTTTELTIRTGELSSERQARKTAEQTLRDIQRKTEAAEKRQATALDAKQASENTRIAALEKQMKSAMEREANLQKQLDTTRRQAQETARDLSATITQLRTGGAGTTPLSKPSVPRPALADSTEAIAEMRVRMRGKLGDQSETTPVLQDERASTPRRALPPGE
jgi:chromosome segregation ATPase